jgi:hypothetical protein
MDLSVSLHSLLFFCSGCEAMMVWWTDETGGKGKKGFWTFEPLVRKIILMASGKEVSNERRSGRGVEVPSTLLPRHHDRT